MNESDPLLTPEEMRRIAEEIIEASPSVAIRVVGENGKWKTRFITKNISKYGYTREDFHSGRLAWSDVVHPDDLPVLINSIDQYESNGIYKYNNIYRIRDAQGRDCWVSDDSTVILNDKGEVVHSDCIISDYTETKNHIEKIEDHYRQQRVFKEILLGLHEADADQAIQIILDSTGVYLDISRAILFKDDPGHQTCKAVYEWDNQGVERIGDFSIDYRKDIPEVYDDLHSKGYRIVNYGDIPSNSQEEFKEEGVIAAAIFAVHVDKEYFGFICFDECVKHRVWPDDQIRFLHNVSKLVAPAIMRKRAEDEMCK